jgi:ABC-type multidrug transport system permease subunit
VQVSLITYFMFGFQNNVGKFFIFVLAVALCLLVAESLGMIFAMMCATAELAVMIAGIVFIVLLALTGLLTVRTPVYYQWIEHFNFLRCGVTFLNGQWS